MTRYLKIVTSRVMPMTALFTVLVVSFLPLAATAQIKFNLQSHITVSSIEELLVAILNIFIIIATPIIVLFIIYAGFLYVTAKGNAQQVEQASRALTYAIIGGVILLGAVAIAEIIKNIVAAFSA